MDKNTRTAIERATQRARKVLEEDFAAQLEGEFDVHRDGAVAAEPGPHLSTRQGFLRQRIAAAIEHKRAAGMTAAAAVADYLRDAAFTTLNRFVALKMLEARELVQECITKGEQSAGYREFCGLAAGVALLPDSAGYRLYVESLFDELSTEVKVLFDRRDPSSVLWPKRATFEQLLEVLNSVELADVWGKDETIGWFYQYFNGTDERRKLRESPFPRNSRELAIRNQFFTPRYVVEFLTDNTLGRIWYEMRRADTELAECCEYMVRTPGEKLELRQKKDPRDLRVLDPACGSGHFLLYSFDLFLQIYSEAYSDEESPKGDATGHTLHEEYANLKELQVALPGLILAHNLHGVDIDSRCAQIAQLALWMRAQRAYRDFGIARASRPKIQRTNIVVSEPLVADDQVAAEFIGRLEDAQLKGVFARLVDTLKLAGELGLLIQLESLIAPGARGGQTADLFALPEARIRAAIQKFVLVDASTSRRLFAEDAAYGVALLELAEKKFDVVVMNPPFGEPTRAGQQYISDAFPVGANDIYAGFVVRFRSMLSDHGRLGAITSRSFFVGRDLRAFRKHLLDAPGARIEAALDLGLGVLDAMVETTAYVLGTGSEDVVRFVDLRTIPKTESSIRSAFVKAEWFIHDREYFRRLPQCQFLYDIEANEAAALASAARIEPGVGRVTKGLSTGDDERFVRLRWEVFGRSATPDGTGWELFSKGGEYGWFGSDVHLLIKRHNAGAELAAHAERTHGNVALSRQSSTYYGRSAVTWSRRSQKGFSARRLRPGVCFSDKSPVIIPSNRPDDWIPVLLATLTTESYLSLIYAQSKFGSYETGSVKALPAPNKLHAPETKRSIAKVLAAIDAVDVRDETCQLFVSPPSLDWDAAPGLNSALDDLRATLRQQGYEFSEKVYEETVRGTAARVNQLRSAMSWVSHGVGLVLGRWGPNVQCGPEPGALDELPAHSVAEAALHAEVALIWLTDDEGGATDIVRRIGEILSERAPGLGVSETQLRDSMRKSFFAWHLAQYSKSARKAPLYWQLSSASNRYSAWVFYHRLKKDSLFVLQSEIVLPKLRHEERRLQALRVELAVSPTSTQRKELAAQEALVEELRSFGDEVRRVAPLWNPRFDDGVSINYAPLWRLVPQHKPWQKELRATWDLLCNGAYDWAHLAMHLWPERVVPKCAIDRSLAIAHGLEDNFWVEGADGKWRTRKVPTRPVDELVRERSSPAVKAALKSLLEAPAAPTGGGRRSSRRRAEPIAEEDTR